jgi:lipid II:glycine glycyltransferase (peptidoglycan interpeptide bridge formation enzyme)
MNDFKTRRDSILQVFSQAKDDLEKLNSDIDHEIEQNNQMVGDLQKRNEELAQMKKNNVSSIKSFSKFFQ